MIVITVELWPGGLEQHKELLGTGIIANDSTGTDTRGNYRYCFSKRGETIAQLLKKKAWKFGRAWKTGTVLNFPRKQLNAWDLLGLALASALMTRWGSGNRS